MTRSPHMRPRREPEGPRRGITTIRLLLGAARVQDGIQVEGDGLVGDDLGGGAGTHLSSLGDRASRNGRADARDAAQVGVGVDDAAANALARRVGRSRNGDDGPGACRSVGDLDDLGDVDVEDEGGNGSGLRRGIGRCSALRSFVG